ncbi:MAG: hypothetical protein IKP46_07160 [Bacteroidales bacterium]|nr:hypothetical protein [Bacteroidales bacterium]
MKALKYIVAVFAVALGISSCGVMKSSTAGRAPFTQLNIDLNQLEYLGEKEITITFDKYLGIFKKIRTINGADFDRSVREYSYIPHLNAHLYRAAPAVYEAFPQADYFIVSRQTSTRHLLFLGSEVEVKATVKAYKRVK